MAIGVITALCIVMAHQSGAQSGQAFTISPPLLDMNATPGQTVNARIKLTNVSVGTLTMSAQTNDFGVKNETGEPNIIFDESQSTPYSMKNWIALPKDFTLKSKQTRELVVPITVPKNAEPGGHYVVVRFTGASEASDSNQVSLSASIGSLILLKVAGNISQQASVEDFYAATPKFEKQSFFETPPVELVARIRNGGNIHVKPTGTVTVKDMFGKEVKILRLNGDPADKKNAPGSILPQSVRRFNVALNDGSFGRYTATMNLTYGEGQSLQQTVSFWIVPYRLILVVVLLLTALIFGAIKGIKAYNAYIIKKAQTLKTKE